MGYKIHPQLNAVPVQCIHGMLTYFIGDTEISVEIPTLKNLIFERQCVQFLCDNVCAFLRNEKYNVVLRFDGTGSIYHTRNRCTLKHFSWDKKLLRFKLYEGGSFKRSIFDTGVCDNGLLAELSDDTYLLSYIRNPISIILDINKGNNREFIQTALRISTATIVTYYKDKLFVLNLDGKPIYELVGEVNYNEGFVVLGGNMNVN